jgi:hypothetical protein
MGWLTAVISIVFAVEKGHFQDKQNGGNSAVASSGHRDIAPDIRSIAFWTNISHHVAGRKPTVCIKLQVHSNWEARAACGIVRSAIQNE